MSKSQISVNTRPGADRYGSEKVIEFSSPVGGGLISFTITSDDQLDVHVYRQDLTVHVTAGEEGEPVRHGNLRADAALYEAARTFVADYETAHPETRVWTVTGYWDEDEPVPTGVIKGQHEVTGDVDYEQFPQGLWAESVTAPDADAAERLAVEMMRDTL